MEQVDTEQLIKRFKSFAWRAGGMLAAATVAFLADNLGLFGFSPEITVLLGLILGEITKYLNREQA